MNLKDYIANGYSTKHSDINHMNISEEELGTIVCHGDAFLQGNAFFILLNDFQYYEKEGNAEVAAYISYLMSYLVFVVTTPPRSMEIAITFAEKSIELNDSKEYREWLEFVRKGN